MSSQDAAMREAGGRRRPCRQGEYIVIAASGHGATNTIIMQNAPSALDALRGRLAFVAEGEETREQLSAAHDRSIGTWVVTNGVHSFVYEVTRTRDGLEIEQAAGLPPERERKAGRGRPG